MNAEQLRASILQEAIQGKLVPQLDSEGVIEQVGDVPEEVPFEIPESWKWVRLEATCEYIQRGKSPKYSIVEKIPVIAQKCNQWDGFHIEKAKFIDPETLVSYKKERLLQDNDVLWNSTGLGTLGRVSVYEDRLNPYGTAVADSHVTVIRPKKNFLLSKFLYFYLRSETVQSVIESRSDGSTKQKELSTKTIKAYEIPLPPLEEQKRIVAKVEELLPLVEEYGKSYDHLQKINAELPEKLKASILQEAIQGKLVSQLDSEGVVEQVGDAPEEVSFEIPESWKWVQLSALASIVRGGSPRPIKSYITDNPDGLNWIKIGDAERGTARITKCAEKIIPEGLKKTRFIKKGSLLLTNSMSFGYPYILEVDGCIHDGWLAFSNFEETLTIEYFYFALLSPYCRSTFIAKAAGAVVKNLNIEKVKEVFIPVPPLEEQKRIVAKVEELLKQVDALKV